MKKVLIIAHLGGSSPRIPGLAKYLPEFGWMPIILTAKINDKPDLKIPIVETEYRDILDFWRRIFRISSKRNLNYNINGLLGTKSRKLKLDPIFKIFEAIIFYPDGDKGWQPFAVKAANEILKNGAIDAIISSSSPVTSHIIAREIKIKNDIPWIADLRDLWSQNHNYHYGYVRNYFDKRMEKNTLSIADALVTVSDNWAQKLKDLHSREHVYAIPNGFDPIDLNIPATKLSKKFVITYTGRIYRENQDPSKFFDAIRELISEGVINPINIEIRFYGNKEDWLEKMIQDYGLSAIAKQYGIVPRNIALEKQRESTILLLFTWEGEEKACYGIKTFEYLAAQRPILATGIGNCMHKELLRDTNAGIYCKTIEDIKSALRTLFSEYEISGQITYSANSEKIAKFSYREMAKEFAHILNNII